MAVEARNLEAMAAAFEEDAVPHSPVRFKPFEAREAIHALSFRAPVGDRDVDGPDLIRMAESGRIRELTVRVRPRSAPEALLGEVGSHLARLGAA